MTSRDNSGSPRKRKREQSGEYTSVSETVQDATSVLGNVSLDATTKNTIINNLLELCHNLQAEKQESVQRARFLEKKLEKKSAVQQENCALKAKIERLEQHLQQVTQTKEKIQASKLSYFEALAAYKLNDGNVPVEWIRHVKLPPWLKKHLAKIEENVLSKATLGEAFARLKIDAILMAAFDENRIESKAREALDKTPMTQLSLMLEQKMESEVMIEGKPTIVSGIADYAIYYEKPYHDTTATGLIAMEAKKKGCVGDAMGQLVAYMGTIHNERKAAKKQNAIVWGFASDGNEFDFCRIDQDGNFSQSERLLFTQNSELIFGLICGIINAAAHSSPTTSLGKDPRRQKKIMESSGSPKAAKKFDYGLGDTA